jgi:hypothetical protein
MNPPNQPTPRTNAAWAKTFESELNQFWSGNAANQMRDECEKLERELTETERLRFGADADRRRLRAEVERLTAKIGNQADRIRYLEGATNHATGTPLSQAIARAEKAEAALADWSVLNLWGGTPEIIHEFIKGQQTRIHHCQDIEAELATERARLDWLEANPEAVKASSVFKSSFGRKVWWYSGGGNYDTARAAIDASMKNESNTP